MRNYTRRQKEELSALISVNVSLAFSLWIHIFQTPIHKKYADIAFKEWPPQLLRLKYSNLLTPSTTSFCVL